MAEFPDGIKFTVRCLAGGAHDLSTWIGEFATMAEAVNSAQNQAAKQADIQNRFRV
jgi:hypothetical protein